METLEKGEKYVQNRNMLAIKTPERRQADDFIVTYFTPRFNVSIVNFEQVNAGWVLV